MDDELIKKVKEHFEDLVIYKINSRKQEFNRIPRFIAEYFIMKFNPEGILTLENKEKISTIINELYPEPSYKHKLLSDLMIRKSIELLGEFKVRTHLATSSYHFQIPVLSVVSAKVVEEIVLENENLLINGMWGIAELQFIEGKEKAGILVTKFIPFQIPYFSLDFIINRREFFTLDEWIDILINTIGMKDEIFTRREKLLHLCRLISLVESNCCILELGPKNTGKTYFYREMSYYTQIISGGVISPAVLFYHGVYKEAGLLATKDVVVFDEISKIELSKKDETIGKLKDFLESGNFDRLGKKIRSTTSFVMLGNILLKKNSAPLEQKYLNALPVSMQDTAFIMRINAIIPGWEFKEIKKREESLSDGYGFVGDYFAEYLHFLRKENFQTIIEEYVSFSSNFNIRDQKSVLRVASGLLKILRPDKDVDEEILEVVMDLAIELRQYVIDQLHLFDPNEFAHKTLDYEINFD